MLYLVYKTTNKVNGKVYIGCHITENENDGYLGSGTVFRMALAKHGPKSFEREILKRCDSEEEMYSLESEIVTWDLIRNGHCYNISPGGNGGWRYVNTLPRSRHKRNTSIASKEFSARIRTDQEFVKRFSESIRIATKNRIAKTGSLFGGRRHSDKTKSKMSESAIRRLTRDGNGMSGRIWVNDGSVEKAIPNNEIEPGWTPGRLKR